MIETINGKELAEMLGVSTRWIAELEKTGVLVKDGYGKWDLRKSVQGYCRYLKEQAAGNAEGGYDADKARKMKADADLAEIVAAKAAGKLVVAKSVGAAWSTAIGLAMSKLGGVGQKIGALVILERTAKGAADKIDDAIRGACEELHQVDIASIAAAQEEEEALKSSGSTQ